MSPRPSAEQIQDIRDAIRRYGATEITAESADALIAEIDALTRELAAAHAIGVQRSDERGDDANRLRKALEDWFDDSVPRAVALQNMRHALEFPKETPHE